MMVQDERSEMNEKAEGAPPPHPVIHDYLMEAERQDAEAHALVGSLTDVQANWRPKPGAWSVLENLTHLTLTNRVYVNAIEEATRRGRAMGLGACNEPPQSVGGVFCRRQRSEVGKVPGPRKRSTTYGQPVLL